MIHLQNITNLFKNYQAALAVSYRDKNLLVIITQHTPRIAFKVNTHGPELGASGYQKA